jgi:hypothetical protein
MLFDVRQKWPSEPRPAGDEGLRSVLVSGAMIVLRHVRNGKSNSSISLWLEQLLKRTPPSWSP